MLSVINKTRKVSNNRLVIRLFSSSQGSTVWDEPLDQSKYPKSLKTKQFGIEILHDPLWNKSMAFDHSERDRLGLRGLLPPVVRNIEGQAHRLIEQVRSRPDAISKNLMLQSLCDRNETLFHRLLVEYIEELAPIVYTPTGTPGNLIDTYIYICYCICLLMYYVYYLYSG